VENEDKLHMLSFTQLAMVLTGITLGVSSIHLGFFKVPIALAIACIKVSFVLLFFMHLRYKGKIIKISFLSSVAVLVVLIGFTFWDVAYS